jgi:CRISPR-associated protein (TIGR02710 family)
VDQVKHTLLICTVGGSSEPIVATLMRWNPARTRFVVTPETRGKVDADVVPLAKSEGIALDPGRYDLFDLHDGQDFAACVDSLRQLTPVVEQWLARGNDYQVVVDFTGGTKCMSAALALQAHRWRCVFSYVGGSERTKDGVGIVISGKEQVLHAHNPWDALGFQAVEEFVALFDQQAFAAAAALAERATKNVSEQSRKRELNALKLLADAYDAWDRFDHKGSMNKLQELAKYENDMRAVLGKSKAEQIRTATHRHRDYLRALGEGGSPSLTYVVDLLANARRRKSEGRIDDAVARLYRAIESLAQVTLAKRHQIANTKQVPLTCVPDSLHSQWASRADNGNVFLGLQDAYALLDALGDELGTRFKELGLHDRNRSPLTARNQSILAHGFDRVSDGVFDQLWEASLALSDRTEDGLPSFPRMEARPLLSPTAERPRGNTECLP